MPSDGSLWTTLRDPFCWAVRICFSLPIIGTLLFCVLFGLIKRNDEFQLVSYIAQAKSFQGLTVGVYSLIVAGVRMYSCLQHLDQAAMDIDQQAAAITACATDAPGNRLYEKATLLVEPLRAVCIWTAFGLLVCGYATGGEEKLRALERVRIDAADGRLDGELDVAAAEEKEEKEKDDDPTNDPTDVISEKELEAATQKLLAERKLQSEARRPCLTLFYVV